MAAELVAVAVFLKRHRQSRSRLFYGLEHLEQQLLLYGEKFVKVQRAAE